MFDENKIIINLQKLNIKNEMNFLTSFFNTDKFIVIVTILRIMNYLNNKDILKIIIASYSMLIVKLIFKRTRPFRQNNNIMKLSTNKYDTMFSKYSFPSGHTLAASILTIILLNKYPQNKVLSLLPIIIGFTRVYLGVHYPSDVVCGILFAFLINQFF